jgi:hypothetical protein
MDENELFFIMSDFAKVGLIVDPVDQKPIVLGSDDIVIPLSSIEIVENPFRMMFLQMLQQEDPNPYMEHRLVRLDVITSVSELQEQLAGNRAENDEETQMVREYQENLKRLILNTRLER